MKVVWILNHYAVLPDEPGGTRHFKLARGIQSSQWQTVIIGSSFGHWNKVQRIRGCSLYRDTVRDSIRFRFLKTPGYSGNGILRILNMISFFLVAIFPPATRELPRPDVVIGSSVHPLAALAGAFLARKHAVPFVFEIRDLWPETLVRMKRLKEESILARMLYQLEYKLLKMADKIIVLLPHADEYLGKKGVDLNKVEWLPNGVEIGEAISRSAKNDKVTIMYLGAHGSANDLDTLLEAIRILQKEMNCLEVQFRFIGEGPAKQGAIQLSKEYALENVSFEESIPSHAVSDKLSESDACILAMQDLPELYKYGISLNKIYDYMAAGKPILAALSAANNPIVDARAGLTVTAGDSRALAEAIQSFLEMSPGERKTMGDNGREYACEHYDYRLLANKLGILLNDLGIEGS